MQKIHVLDTIVANQIAAGEVVDRPASVLKELVENSIDAGATVIDIEIAQGGIEYLRVTDNGSGMSKEDALMALERHATSKIVTAEDLHKIDTLGFRGEALPSIASVSKFQLITRTAQQELATSVLVEGGKLIEVDTCGGNTGTSIIIEDLFFNLPARKKFLKTVATETRYINDLVTRLALSSPHIKFSLKNNDRIALKTSGSGDLAECIHALFGKEVSEQLLPVDYTTDNLQLSGYISNPSFTKNNRYLQFSFVNKRSVTSKLIYKALDTAYQSKIARGTHAFALLNIAVDTNEVDVNVHPQKQEVKFSDEGAIFKKVFRALVQALEYPLVDTKAVEPAQTTATPAPTQTTQTIAEHKPQPVHTAPAAREQSSQVDITARPAVVQETKFIQPGEQSIWRSDDPTAGIVEYLERKKSPAYTDVGLEKSAPLPSQPPEPSQPTVPTVPAPAAAKPVVEQAELLATDKATNTPQVIGQFLNKYILAALGTDLYIIDQHAAHERVIYDQLVANKKLLMIQDLLVAEFVQLIKPEIELVSEYLEDFAALGLNISLAGSNTIRIESAPAGMNSVQIKEFFAYMLARLGSYNKPSIEDFRREVAHSMSCKAAIKAGDNMSVDSMQKLLERLYATQNPFTCPHGRPLITKFSEHELNKLFKRS